MEEFKVGDIFYVPFMERVEDFCCVYIPTKERQKLTGPAIFMVEYEKDIKNLKDFTYAELNLIAKKCVELERDGYFCDGLVIELTDFDDDENAIPIPLVSKNVNTAVHMQRLLVEFCKVYKWFGFN